MGSRKTVSQLTQQVKICAVSLHNTLQTLQALVKFTLRLFFWLRTSKRTMASVLAWDPSPLQRHFLMTKNRNEICVRIPGMGNGNNRT